MITEGVVIFKDIPSQLTKILGDIEVAVRCSNSVYTGIGSAIAFLYWKCSIERRAKLKDSISLYCKGLKHRGATLKQQLVVKSSEGK